MPYDEHIESRITAAIAGWKGIDRRQMFGGVGYLLDGNMFAGILKDFLILRLGEKGGDEALALPHVKPFDITGRPMKGWVMISPEGYHSDDALKNWLRRARDFAAALPPK